MTFDELYNAIANIDGYDIDYEKVKDPDDQEGTS